MRFGRESMSARPSTARGAMAAGLLLWVSAAIAGAATYAHVPTSYNWIDPSGHTPVTWSNPSLCQGFGDTIGDDSLSPLTNIGFTFQYGGTAYTQLYIMTNGRVQFGSGNTECGAGSTSDVPRVYNLAYPSGNLKNTMKIYGADQDASPNGAGGGGQPTTCPFPGCAMYFTATPLGTAPNRQFVVTWVAVPDWASTASFFNLQLR